MPTWCLERSLKGIVAGIDEAGRGALAGPVVAAAVVLPEGFDITGIDDSKKLSSRQRAALYERIIKYCHYQVAVVEVEDIEALNILGATMLAMQQTMLAMNEVDHFLIDGNRSPSINRGVIHEVVGGDGISYSIASASILAKVTRDSIMAQLANHHPHYNWQKNCGYGTKEHMAAIKNYGPTTHHRRSFLKKLLLP